MGNHSRNTHPLIRDGRSQEDRRLTALNPENVKVDDSNLDEILEFIYEYAKRINYYYPEKESSEPNDQTGQLETDDFLKGLDKKDWVNFFKNSVPFLIARIVSMDLEDLRKEYEIVSVTYQREPDYPALNPILDLLFDLVKQIDAWKKKLDKDTSGLKAFLENLISSNLSSALGRLITYGNAGGAWKYRSKFYFEGQQFWGLTLMDFLAVDKELAAAAMGATVVSPIPDPEEEITPTLGKKKGLTLAKSNLDELFETFLEAIAQIQQEAKQRLQDSINNTDAHEPHLGLFFAFLEVFQLARNDLNRMTQRHLDFYYKKVLQLKERDAVLDKAHLIFEISPFEETYRMAKGTRFTAGDDDQDVEIHFELEEDIIVDSAQVESLRTIYLDQTPLENSGNTLPKEAAYQVKGIFMAPQANSADGQGETFKDKSKASWETVGEKVSKFIDTEKTTSRDNPQYKLHPTANLGILLGSKALFLQEGQRKITLRFTCDRPSLEQVIDNFTDFETAVHTQYALTDQTLSVLEENGFNFYIPPGFINDWKNGLEAYQTEIVDQQADLLSKPQRDLLIKHAERRSCFEAYLTIDGDWLSVPQIRIYTDAVDTDRFDLVLELDLDENQPPIIAFDPEVHGLNLELNVPAVRLEFNHDFVPLGPIGDQGVSIYNYFRFLKVLDTNFEVEVDNLRDLILQNSDGVFGADAPFQPFGAEPLVGEDFFIGSQEIFQKNLTGLQLQVDWGGLPDDPFWLHYLGYQAFPEINNNGEEYAWSNEIAEQVLSSQVTPDDFSFELKILKNRAWQNFTVPSRHKLFDNSLPDDTPNDSNDNIKTGKPLAGRSFDFTPTPAPLIGSDIPEEFEELEVGTTAGFLRWRLKPADFKHDAFPSLLDQHLTAQGLWEVEIAQAEALKKLEIATQSLPADQQVNAPEIATFEPSGINPEVVYLNLEEMVAILSLATLELMNLLTSLEDQYVNRREALDQALEAINTPIYWKVKSNISEVDGAISQIQDIVTAFWDALTRDNFSTDPDKDGGLFEDLRDPNLPRLSLSLFIQGALELIKKRLVEKDGLTDQLNQLMANLEDAGSQVDPLHYINQGALAAIKVLEVVENQALFAVESLMNIANIITLFYTPDGEDFSYHTHYVPLPKEPYTPEITSMSITYTAQAGSEELAFFHLHPFEGTYKQQEIGSDTEQPELLPKFIEEGNLFLGINNLRPESNLQLLFQMAESTADPFTEQAEVSWSYLADNRWRPLENGFEVLSDETNGLIKSGVVKLAIPRAINTNNTILPPELHWIRASVSERAKAVSETVAVHTQSARVRFIDRDNDLSRLAKPLSAESITEAVNTFDEILSVNQLYNSFGGRLKEDNIGFYTRVSERLRHKGRAVTLFDYERLILENFPEVYKVKCITHTLGRMAGAEEDNHLAPGFVTIALIPNLRNITGDSRFEPRATVALLKDIEKLIRKKTSPFVRLRVLNPDYEAVNFSGNIGFVEGTDENFFKDQLRRDVQQFLAPWAFDPVSQIAFGGRIFRSTVLRFVEEQSYVDFVTDFTMFGADKKNVSDIAATSARSILVPGRIKFEAIECCVPAAGQQRKK